MKYSVRDGVRTLEFEGVKLAGSTSWSPGKPRWVEFELYRTPKNQYVLARIGDSLYYHNSECFLVMRNKLSALQPPDELGSGSIPCPECRATRFDVEGIFPETPRYMAQVSSDAIGVISSIMKRDENGTEYLTNVARRLMVEASKWDQDIADVFYVDHIE